MSAWLPIAGAPVGWVTIDGKRHKVEISREYQGAFNEAFNTRLGGIGGKSVTSVDATAQGASGVVVNNAAALQALLDSTIETVAVLTAAVASLQAAGAPGAGAIVPPADPGTVVPPIDPGDEIPGYDQP